MGRISKIEDIVAGSLPPHSQLKLIPRGRPQFIDSQLDGGFARFVQKRGAQFGALLPDNVGYLASDAYRDSYVTYLVNRPSWISINCLVRLGITENTGELHTVKDTIDPNGLEFNEAILVNHTISSANGLPSGVFLIGTPMTVLSVYQIPIPTYPVPLSDQDRAKQDELNSILTNHDPKTSIFVKSWYPLVPQDILIGSPTPENLPSLNEWVIREALPLGTMAGDQEAGEPSTLYLYELRLSTQTGLLPFIPEVGLRMYLKAHPLYMRRDFREIGGDITLPSSIGPFLVDAFYGSLLSGIRTNTWLGIKKWDSFGSQLNPPESKWDVVQSNYLIYERPISSDSLLFWQRIKGNFQFQKKGYFQAELDNDGEFIMSSDLLVPQYPTNVPAPYGWVIPIFARADLRIVIQWEPQEQQIFEVPGNTLTYIRPRIYPSSGSGTTGATINEFTANTAVITTPSKYYAFTTESIGKQVTLSGAKNRVNNGSFEINSILAANSIMVKRVDSVNWAEGYPDDITQAETGIHWSGDSSWVTVPNGNNASIGSFTTNKAVATNSTSAFDVSLLGKYITISEATNSINNGRFLIVEIISSTSIRLERNDGVDWSVSGSETGLTWVGEANWVTPPSGGASINSFTSNSAVIIAELPSFDSSMLGKTIGVTGAVDKVNNGQFLITEIISNVSIRVERNDGIDWVKGYPTEAETGLTWVGDSLPVTRMIFSIKGPPNTRAEIRDWEYDGQVVSSLSYFILGTGATWGESRWMGGGFSIKPMFYSLATLQARYSDGSSRYNSGYIYS